MKRIRRTPAQWKRLIKTFHISELKAAEFCRQHKIDEKYFSKKKNEIDLNSAKIKSFVKVEVNNSALVNQPLLSFNYKNCSLNFYQLPDIEYLSNLIKSVP